MTLENWLRNKLQEIEEMHEYSIATDAVRAWIDLYNKEFFPPKYVQDAQKYVASCVRDMGFMGSPEYDKQRKIIDDYFAPIEKEKKRQKEIAELKRLLEMYSQVSEGEK